MLDLFNIPKQCFVNKTIPLEKFFDKGVNYTFKCNTLTKKRVHTKTAV